MLYEVITIRHAPFMLWINDLAAPDRLYVGITIPYLGGLPVLTLLMGVSMFVQQKMSPTTGDPRQEKMMLMMPVVFTVFFVNLPSGLVITSYSIHYTKLYDSAPVAWHMALIGGRRLKSMSRRAI